MSTKHAVLDVELGDRATFSAAFSGVSSKMSTKHAVLDVELGDRTTLLAAFSGVSSKMSTKHAVLDVELGDSSLFPECFSESSLRFGIEFELFHYRVHLLLCIFGAEGEADGAFNFLGTKMHGCKYVTALFL